jgi:hypothetical protein
VTSARQIYHQVMSAMRVLHKEFIEDPQQVDKKFKPRRPSPNKWKILQEGFPGDQLALENNNVSSEEDARMTCTALQNVLYC